MRKAYPDHWRLPTPETLTQHVFGIKQGLVAAGHPALSQAADKVTDIQGNRELRRTDSQLRQVLRNMREAGYLVAGLHAVQIGVSARLAIVPHPTEPGQMLTVVNGRIKPDANAPLGALVPHGCHSGNEVFAKLRVPESHTLYGYDLEGEPFNYHRTGFNAVVDQHELWHGLGARAMDIAATCGLQLDCRPPENAQEYRDFFDGPNGYGQNPHLPNWRIDYPPDQWEAVKVGEFVLMNFVNAN